MQQHPRGTLPSRHTYQHAGRTIYEWEQGYDEVSVYIAAPPGASARALDVKISVAHLRLGLRGNPPFLDADLSGSVVLEDSTWTLVEGTLTVILTKARPGETWPAVFVGHAALDALATDEAKRQMLLERFQMEHPGFDFSGAEVSGSVPDPRNFMRGGEGEGAEGEER